MSKFARTTAWCFFFIVTIIFAYGKGHQHGRRAQLTYDQVIAICKAQFFDAIEHKRKSNK